MVGEGVLHECLQHENVEEILVVGRRSCGLSHPRMKEILVPDFFDLSAVSPQLTGYNTCFFCLGVSSIGLKEAEYYKLTYKLTMNFATILANQNPGMVFCYVSGAGTDESEQGRVMWARVKGKTENDLAKLPFRQVYFFRPGIMKPTKGLKNTLRFYKYFGWLIPVVKLFAPNSASTLKQVGLAMITAASKGYEKQTIEVSDILKLSKT